MKKNIFRVWGALALGFVAATAYTAEDRKDPVEQPMTNARLEEIIRRVEPGVKGAHGRWEMVRDGVPLLVMTEESRNRMRIIAPIGEAKETNQEILMRMMEANFATALDARYAIFEDIVWAAFIHALDSLHERDLISGLQQVVTLVKTTGTTFSSSELQFGPSHQEK